MVTRNGVACCIAGARSVNNGTVAIALDGESLDHWHSVV